MAPTRRATPNPRGLDFGDASRQTSMGAFEAWITDIKTRGEQATGHYQRQLAATTDPHEQAAAVARLVQIPRFIAGLLMRAEIPTDMRSGELALEKQDAFCDQLAQVSEPLLARADGAAETCAK